jgi:hypothetical protein
MSRMMCVSSTKVKATRNTSRPAAPFGRGILRFVAFAVTAPGFVEPSIEDRMAAAQMFGDAGEPDYDTLAGESAAVTSMEAMTPPPAGLCRSCGEPAEALYCDACDDAGTAATIAGESYRAGAGYRVN